MKIENDKVKLKDSVFLLELEINFILNFVEQISISCRIT